MTEHVVIVEVGEVVVIDGAPDLHVIDVDRDIFVVTMGEQGPQGVPGTGDDTGEDGQIWTIADGVGYWADPAPSGVDPAALAGALAFAAAHG